MNRAYSLIKMFGGLSKRIDDKSARQVAQLLFGIEDSDLEKAKVCTVEYYIRRLIVQIDYGGYGWWFGQTKIPVNVYAVTDNLYLYYAHFGYDPENNIIVYAPEIRVKKI